VCTLFGKAIPMFTNAVLASNSINVCIASFTFKRFVHRQVSIITRFSLFCLFSLTFFSLIVPFVQQAHFFEAVRVHNFRPGLVVQRSLYLHTASHRRHPAECQVCGDYW
jgi:hypothetical protein